MTTPDPPRRDFSWPVSIDELQELEVLEILRGPDGQVLWRCDDGPAASPADCGGVLMQHRHPADSSDFVGTVPLLAREALTPLAIGESIDLASPPSAAQAPDMPELSELPVLPASPLPEGLPEPGLRTPASVPDLPLAPQAPQLTDMPLHLRLESVDESEMPVQAFQAAEDDISPTAQEWAESQAVVQVVELPPPQPLPAIAGLTEAPDPPQLMTAELKEVATAGSLRENAAAADAPAVPRLEVFEDDALPSPPDVPGIPELAAILALTDMPDVPVVLEPSELLDVAAASPPGDDAVQTDVPLVSQFDAAGDHEPASPRDVAELPGLAARADVPSPLPMPQAPESLAVAAALQENAEFLDVPVLHVLQPPPELHAMLADQSPEPQELLPFVMLPRLVRRPRRAEWQEARELALARQWPQVVEFMETSRAPDLPQVVQLHMAREEPAMDSPEVPAFDEGYAATPFRLRTPAPAAQAPAWVLPPSPVFARIRGGPGERIALVAAGMLLGVAVTIAGVSRGPTATSVGGSAAHVASAGAARGPVLTTAAHPGSMGMSAASALTPSPVAPLAVREGGDRILRSPATTPRPQGAALAAETAGARRQHQPAPAVMGAIQRYAVAYNRLDARATTAVWPSANQQALARTFNGLREQRLTLSSCTTAVNGTRATASCSGTRRYRPRVGDHSTRIQHGQWRFDLRQAAGAWLIASVAGPSTG